MILVLGQPDHPAWREASWHARAGKTPDTVVSHPRAVAMRPSLTALDPLSRRAESPLALSAEQTKTEWLKDWRSFKRYGKSNCVAGRGLARCGYLDAVDRQVQSLTFSTDRLVGIK